MSDASFNKEDFDNAAEVESDKLTAHLSENDTDDAIVSGTP